MTLKDKLIQLNAKIDAVNRKRGVIADVGTAGLVPVSESDALVAGILSPKGHYKLPSTDFNDVTAGGIWLLGNVPEDYTNAPFNDDPTMYPANLWVVRNFGTYPRTDNPAITQFFTSNKETDSGFAYRTKLGSKWSPWKYPMGKILYDGKTPANMDIGLTDSAHDFYTLGIYIFFNGRTLIRKVKANSEFEIPLLSSSDTAVKACDIKFKYSDDGLTLTNTLYGVLINSGNWQEAEHPSNTYILKVIGYSGAV